MDNEFKPPTGKEIPPVGIATVIKPRIDIEPPAIAPLITSPTTPANINPPNIPSWLYM